MSDREMIKGMGTLQKNLHEKQLGLMRCIDEFEDFRANLLVGIPRNGFSNGIEDKFNTK